MADYVIWWSAISTTALAFISFIALFLTLRQNKGILKHNEQTLKKMEMQGMPCISENTIEYDVTYNKEPSIELTNTGEVGAVIDNLSIVVFLKNYLYFSIENDIDYIVRKGQKYECVLNKEWISLDDGDGIVKTNTEYLISYNIRYKHEADLSNEKTGFYEAKRTRDPLPYDIMKKWNECVMNANGFKKEEPVDTTIEGLD